MPRKIHYNKSHTWAILRASRKRALLLKCYPLSHEFQIAIFLTYPDPKFIPKEELFHSLFYFFRSMLTPLFDIVSGWNWNSLKKLML